MLKIKWNTYHNWVEKHNTSWLRNYAIVNYNLSEIKSLSFDNTSWNSGNSTHPDDKWAVGKATQRGTEECSMLF